MLWSMQCNAVNDSGAMRELKRPFLKTTPTSRWSGWKETMQERIGERAGRVLEEIIVVVEGEMR